VPGMRRTWLQRKKFRMAVAIGVLLLGLLASLLAGWQVRRDIRQDAIRQFAAACEAITIKIQERLTAYAVMLQGGQALFSASESVERDEWRTYIETLKADQTVPGYEGIGFCLRLTPEELASHEAAVRSEGFPDYRVTPADPRDAYSSIVYLEPFRGRNLLAFGYDMFSEPVRRQAMEQARDTGRPALSGKVTLIQEGGDENAQAGSLMYVPVYRNGRPVGSVEQRRAALFGWVYSAYRMEDLMRGTIPEWSAEGSSFVDLHIFDGEHRDDAHLLFDSQPDEANHNRRTFLHEERTIDFNGRHWLLVFNGSQTADQVSYTAAWLTAAGGSVISGLLFGMLLLLFKRVDAQRMAEGFAEQIRGMAYHDSLTKLPNRRLLSDRLQMALAGCKRSGSHGALMMVDLDNFKPLNDTHGHAAGDLLLTEAAKRLRGCVRETDTVARIGGDEFIVLLAGLTGGEEAAKDEAAGVADKMLHALCSPYHLSQVGLGTAPIEHRCSASVGLTLFAGDETDQSAIVKRADDAMYSAKRTGRNRVCFVADKETAGGRA
jgi:diguanylate cyclase (GGDEF)-like protein